MTGQRLPVLATAMRGWRMLTVDWPAVLPIVFAPVAILVALDIYLDTLWDRQIETLAYTNLTDTADKAYLRLVNIDMVLALLLGALMVALWQRLQLTGRPMFSFFGLLAAWRNVGSLTLHWCGLILVTIGLDWVIGSRLGTGMRDFLSEILIKKYGLIDYPALYRVLMDLVLEGGPLFLALYIPGRLGLMLWARPIGSANALDKAWNAGAGNGWRIVAAIFVAILPVMILESVLEPGAVQGSDLLGFHVWFDLSNILQLIIGVAVIAAVHKSLLGSGDSGESPTAEISAAW